MPAPRSSRALRPAVLAAAAGLSFGLCAQTVNLAPGLYELTSTADLKLPPDLAAKLPPQALALMQKPHVTQHCISRADLEHVSQQLAEAQGREPQGCKVTDRSMTGSAVKFTAQCEHGSVHFEGTFASESFQGTMVSTSDQGQTVTVRIAAHRVGDCSK